jgi:hypothetical protein
MGKSGTGSQGEILRDTKAKTQPLSLEDFPASEASQPATSHPLASTGATKMLKIFQKK